MPRRTTRCSGTMPSLVPLSSLPKSWFSPMKNKFLWACLPSYLALANVQPLWATPAITAIPNSMAGLLPLEGQGTTTTNVVKVAKLTLSTDHARGYTLMVTSGNITKIGGTPIAFQVTTVPANSAAPSAGDFTVPTSSTYLLTTSMSGTEDRDLYIRYTPGSLQDPGAYSGNISLTITDNP